MPAAETATACARPDQRVLAGPRPPRTGAPVRFETCRDGSFGGGTVVPCRHWLEDGLSRHSHDCLKPLRGYYSTLHVISSIAAHWRCVASKTVEQLQYQPPGEFGKQIGAGPRPRSSCIACDASSPP